MHLSDENGKLNSGRVLFSSDGKVLLLFFCYYILFLFTAYSWNNSYVAAVSGRAALGRPSDFQCWHNTSLSSHLCNNWQNARCRGISWSSACKTLYRWGKIKIKNPKKVNWFANMLIFPVNLQLCLAASKCLCGESRRTQLQHNVILFVVAV